MVGSLFYTNFASELTKTPMKERILQLVTAAVLSIGGLVLLFVAMLIDPAGQIHDTLLIGFGEVATFAGAIMGVEYSYRHRGPRKKGRLLLGRGGSAATPSRNGVSRHVVSRSRRGIDYTYKHKYRKNHEDNSTDPPNP